MYFHNPLYTVSISRVGSVQYDPLRALLNKRFV
jgi:hypothetical protein